MARKKAVLLWLLVSICVAAKAQFFALAFGSVRPYVTVLPYPKDGNFRVVSFNHYIVGGPQNRTSIKVYNSSRQYIRSVELLRGITFVNDYPPLIHNNHFLWPANFADTIKNGVNSLVLLELDLNYNHISMHTIVTHSEAARPSGIVGYSGGFVIGEYFSGVAPTRTGVSTKLFKLGLNFSKTDSVWLEDELRIKTHRSQNNLIVGASDDISTTCASTVNTTQKIVLDTNLNIIDCLNLPANSIYFCYNGSGSIVLRFADVYKRKGIVFPISNYRNYIHSEIDFYNCTNSTFKYNVVKNATLKGNTSAGSYVNDNYSANTQYPLYFSSNTDYDGRYTVNVTTVGLKENYAVDKNFFKPYYAKNKTKLRVTKIDTTGNMIWKREYGGEMNYFPRSIAFTADGGCVIAGSRYDSATMYPNKVFENFLLKLDEAGDIVGLNTNTSTSLQICYPNPASQFVHFDVPSSSNSIIKLFNCFGQQVLENGNYQSAEPLIIGNLTSGVYTYIVSDGDKRWWGKLVVE